ncbi:MAG: hypothetical protein JXR60_07065 [Bacteroidales bacterium]|nr:hypothetical protein [Bacteroidales bacterium]
MKTLFPFFVFFFLLTSCEKYRTDYLSRDQKDIINAFSVGDTFTMLRNGTDTFNFVVTKASYSSMTNGKWYENLGPHTWTERGSVLFETTNRIIKENGSIRVEGDAPSNSIDLLLDDIRPMHFIKFFEVDMNGIIFNNCFLLHSDDDKYNIHDSAYISLNHGLLKVWNSELEYLRID